ncbi:hypothetical protein FHR84_003486 [Actinopolyspora biskrensis]|uniref:Uncharacterized protein n=1 Tax=Actinopolyspora biskrensis TaxID=1470178 RepID=A0A852ZBW5_9ACTN|nr:hypothetical protein [Actinopolyspora biskrensis]
MARDQGSSRPNPSFFGSVDPFCWILVIPLLLFGVFLGVVISAALGAGLAVLALLVLLADAWINWRWHRTWGRKPVPRESRRGRRR